MMLAEVPPAMMVVMMMVMMITVVSMVAMPMVMVTGHRASGKHERCADGYSEKEFAKHGITSFPEPSPVCGSPPGRYTNRGARRSRRLKKTASVWDFRGRQGVPVGTR